MSKRSTETTNELMFRRMVAVLCHCIFMIYDTYSFLCTTFRKAVWPSGSAEDLSLIRKLAYAIYLYRDVFQL